MNSAPTKRASIIGHVYLLIGIFLISSNFIVGNYGHTIPPWQLAFFRFFIALIAILPLTFFRFKKSTFIYLTRHWRLLLIYAVLGITIPGGFAYISLRETTAINGAFIFASSPIITLIVAWAFLHEKLNKLQWSGVVVTLFGVLIIISHGNINTLLHMKFTAGDLWMLANAICWAFYTVLIKLWKMEVDQLTLLTAMIFVGLVIMLPFCGYEIFNHAVVAINLKNTLTLLYAGIFAGALAYFTYIRGVHAVGPSKAGVFMYLMPVFATIQAYFFLNEKLHSYHWIAILFIALGIFLAIFYGANNSREK